MEIAFTALNEQRSAHDTVLVIKLDAIPREGELVEIDDIIHVVENVEWHFSTSRSDKGDFPVGELDDIIVRLNKIGEA